MHVSTPPSDSLGQTHGVWERLQPRILQFVGGVAGAAEGRSYKVRVSSAGAFSRESLSDTAVLELCDGLLTQFSGTPVSAAEPTCRSPT